MNQSSRININRCKVSLNISRKSKLKVRLHELCICERISLFLFFFFSKNFDSAKWHNNVSRDEGETSKAGLSSPHQGQYCHDSGVTCQIFTLGDAGTQEPSDPLRCIRYRLEIGLGEKYIIRSGIFFFASPILNIIQFNINSANA